MLIIVRNEDLHILGYFDSESTETTTDGVNTLVYYDGPTMGMKASLVNDEIVIGIDNDALAQDNLIKARLALAGAKMFGNNLANDFSSENILLGVTTAQAETVLTVMGGVLVALQSGSLHVAIARAKAIDLLDYDGTFITTVRLLEYVNKIETYLGIALSETL